MSVTTTWLQQAEQKIRVVLIELRPQLLEAQGHIEHELKGDKSIVTKMDLLVEERLREAMLEFAPEVGFAGEETGADYEQQTFWLVDPIDGTEPFTRGLPFATNMIALIHDGRPRLGVVYNFTTDEFFSAIEGQGAFCNGHAIHVSDRPIDRAFVALGGVVREHNPNIGIDDRLRDELGVAATIRAAATGYELVAVATGAIEGRLTYKCRAKPWDFAPGTLIVQEAGGRVANVGSDEYDYRDSSVVVANPVVFDTLASFMRDLTQA
jgi:myo-inositol-1(or 4)-monophosphatase